MKRWIQPASSLFVVHFRILAFNEMSSECNWVWSSGPIWFFGSSQKAFIQTILTLGHLKRDHLNCLDGSYVICFQHFSHKPSVNIRKRTKCELNDIVRSVQIVRVDRHTPALLVTFGNTLDRRWDSFHFFKVTLSSPKPAMHICRKVISQRSSPRVCLEKTGFWRRPSAWSTETTLGNKSFKVPRIFGSLCYCERVSVQEWVGGPLMNENYYVVDSICSMHQKCRQMKRERRLCSGKIIDKRGRENENNGLEQRTTFWMRTHCYTQDTKVPPHPPPKKKKKKEGENWLHSLMPTYTITEEDARGTI